MLDDPKLRAPAVCRWSVSVASWLVPREGRAEWRRRWQDGMRHWWAFLAERDELGPAAYARFLRYCGSAIADALTIRFQRAELRRRIRGPRFVLACASGLLIAIAIASTGFAGLRAVWRPACYRNPEQLVYLTRTDPGGGRWGLPSHFVKVYADDSKLMAEMAAYQQFWDGLWVTPNFFSVIGTRPMVGRTLAPGDEDAQPRPVVLSYGLWRRRFSGRTDAIGREFSNAGGRMVVVGVMPDGFWAVSTRAEIFSPMRLADRLERFPRSWVGVIGRMKPGVKVEQIRAELSDVAGKHKFRNYGLRLTVLPAEERAEGTFLGYGLGIALSLMLGAALVVLRKLPLAGLASGRNARRYWSFFGAKTLLLLIGLAALWIEGTSAVRLRVDNSAIRDLVGGIAFSLSFFIGCGCAMCWSFYDQRRRCPVCLHRLSMPVTIGSWSSPLLEPATTELMCEMGHGTLCLPETQSSASEPDRWTALDESWQDLFTRK